MCMIYTLDEIKKRIFPVIQKYNIPAMYLLSLGALYCDLEEVFQKSIDLITVRSVMQNAQTESERSFRDAVIRERVKLNDVA